MTPQQIKLVTDSFMKVLPIAGVTADLFYDHLFEIAPEVRPLFPDDLVEQKKKFIATLAMLISNLHEFGKIAPVVANLGTRHVAYGIVAKHYEPFGAALLKVLEDCLGVDFTPPVKAAWTKAYMSLADVMKREAAKLPPR